MHSKSFEWKDMGGSKVSLTFCMLLPEVNTA